MPYKPVPSRKILDTVGASNKDAFVIQNFYCRAMNKRGKCTTVCMKCKENLEEIFAKARAGSPRNPQAVLTWHTRDWIAAQDDKMEAPAELPKTWLGEADDRDPLTLFMEAIR